MFGSFLVDGYDEDSCCESCESVSFPFSFRVRDECTSMKRGLTFLSFDFLARYLRLTELLVSATPPDC